MKNCENVIFHIMKLVKVTLVLLQGLPHTYPTSNPQSQNVVVPWLLRRPHSTSLPLSDKEYLKRFTLAPF